jgi:hypothetical protein
MSLFNASQHPSLHFGPWRIPGPFIPIALVAFPLVVRPRTLAHCLFRPSSKKSIGYSLAVLHLLLYFHIVWGIIRNNTIQHDDIAIPLLSYTSLVLGEAILGTSGFWPYTAIALDWVLLSPQDPLSRRLAKACISLVLAVSAVGERLSTGAKLSALSLLTTAIFQTWSVPRPLAATLAALVVPVLATTFSRIARGQVWYQELHLRSGSLWTNILSNSQLGQYRRCFEVPVTKITLAGAAWVLSSFNWSCFRWRWLLNRGQASRAPSWSMFSLFAGGFTFFPVFLIVDFVQLMQGRDRAANRGDFMQRQVRMCLKAMWYTTCMYTVVWLLLEIMHALEQHKT